MQYATERKRPQVQWMLSLIKMLCQSRVQCRPNLPTDKHPICLVDVGGGRGDLALAIGQCLGAALEIEVHVLVPDINSRSLEQGEQRARVAGLLWEQHDRSHPVDMCRRGGLEFMLCDVSDSQAVKHCLQRRWGGKPVAHTQFHV